MNYSKRLIFSTSLTCLIFLIYYYFFEPIYVSENIMVNFAVHPFNICKEQPVIWISIKLISIISFIFNIFIFLFIFSKKIFYKEKTYIKETKFIDTSLNLDIGFNNKKELISIPEKSLYQNILITGTIRNWKNLVCNVSIYRATYII